jgi:histidine triad (HIT) family protein
MQVKIAEIGRSECPNGFRVVANAGSDANQTVFHLHYHILGGEPICGLAETGFTLGAVLYRDSEMVVYMCNDTEFPVHIIIEPVRNISNLAATNPGDRDLLGRMQVKISELGRHYCPNGFRVITNSGLYAHQVYPFKLRYHILGGKRLSIVAY